MLILGFLRWFQPPVCTSASFCSLKEKHTHTHPAWQALQDVLGGVRISGFDPRNSVGWSVIVI